MSALKTILVTGAASGIGRATTKLFASRGWRVVAASAILAPAVAATGGTLDCLFNCAGLLEMGPHYSIPPKRVDHMLAVNINGVVNCIDAALPALLIHSSSTSSPRRKRSALQRQSTGG